MKATATRKHVQEIYDIIWIVETFQNTMMDNGVGVVFNMYDVSRATRRWPILVNLLKEIGIDVRGAELLVEGGEVQGMSGKGC